MLSGGKTQRLNRFYIQIVVPLIESPRICFFLVIVADLTPLRL